MAAAAKKKTGISLRAYAQHRGCDEGTVRYAIKTGRITPNPDGSINLARADAEWNRNARPSASTQKTGPGDREAIAQERETSSEPVAFNGMSFMQARAANEVLRIKAQQIALGKETGKLIDKRKVLQHCYRFAREFHDAWITFPARVSALMAADLGTDPTILHSVLQKYIHEQLEELSSAKLNVD